MIIKKSAKQIDKMHRAGQLLAEIHKEIEAAIEPGVTLQQIDELAERSIRLRGAVPSFLGYRGFPATICASLNEVVVHGIPDQRPLEEGDIFAVDLGLILDGWHADRATTYPVGKISDEAARLLDATEKSLMAGIDKARPGNRLSDISHAIQQVVEEAGFAVVREYAGHGIGRDMHEDPQVTNYGDPGRGPKLEEGWVLAIEPMVNVGAWQTRLLNDGWTVVTADGSLSAHFEHTVAITANGPLVMTA